VIFVADSTSGVVSWCEVLGGFSEHSVELMVLSVELSLAVPNNRSREWLLDIEFMLIID